MKKFLILLSLVILMPLKIDALSIDLHSTHVYIYDLKDEKMLYQKGDEEENVRIASLTKIMTTIVAIENVNDLKKEVTITPNMLAGIPWDASIAGLKPGDELTYEDLLYASLLPSGADATMSLAHLVSGSVDKFVELMNSKAKQIGLTNTNFVNVTGYDAEGQSSSLKDVFILLKYSLKNDIFKKVYTASSHQMKNGKIVNRTIDMYNKLYNFDLSAIKGSKTGYTNKAGMCMSALLELHDREFIIITLGAEVKPKTAYNLVDTISIIDSITNTFENHIFYDENSLLLNIPVKNSHETSYSVKPSKPIYKFLEISNDIGECTYKYVGKKYLSFKDKEGSTIGKIEYYYDGELIDEDLIILSETFTKSAIKYYGPKIIVFLLILLIILCLYKVSRRKKRRRQKKLY